MDGAVKIKVVGNGSSSSPSFWSKGVICLTVSRSRHYISYVTKSYSQIRNIGKRTIASNLNPSPCHSTLTTKIKNLLPFFLVVSFTHLDLAVTVVEALPRPFAGHERANSARLRMKT